MKVNWKEVSKHPGYQIIRTAVMQAAKGDKWNKKPCGHFNPRGCDKPRLTDESPDCHRSRVCDKFKWIMDRATHYAYKTGLSVGEILDAWEEDRSYWYVNYYQGANQPRIKGDSVRVFDTVDDLWTSVKNPEFRCPACGKISGDPYDCTQMDCNWKSYGLFGTMGKGVTVFIKEKVKILHMFMPVAWETKQGDNHG